MSQHPPFDTEAFRNLEAAFLSPQIVARRREILELLAPRPGARLLDIGAGPGFFAEEAGERVGPGGRVVGIDTSADMLEMAQRRCARLPQVAFLEGDALHLPFEVPSFDAAAASQVYEYVEDVPAALAELHRVLVPGGRAVIVDTDWASLVWEAGDRKRAGRILRAWEDHLADPHLPRRLAPLLRQAGFEVGEVRPYPVFSLAHDPFAAGLATRIAASVPGHRGIGHEEVSAWMAEMEGLSREASYFFSLTGYLFLAVKPSPR